MSSKLSLSLAAALALSTLGGVARASANTITAEQTGNPHSIGYGNRQIPGRSPTIQEIDALEIGNPDSVDYGNRDVPRRSPTNEEISAAEATDPNSVDNQRGNVSNASIVPAPGTSVGQ